jgi:hypothetical protein
LHFLHNMAGEDQGLLPAQFTDQISDLDDLVWVVSAGRLIQD